MRQFRREAAGREGGTRWSGARAAQIFAARQELVGMMCTKGSSGKGIELLLEAAERRVDVSEEQRTFPQADRIGWERMRKGVCMGSEKGRR